MFKKKAILLEPSNVRWKQSLLAWYAYDCFSLFCSSQSMLACSWVAALRLLLHVYACYCWKALCGAGSCMHAKH